MKVKISEQEWYPVIEIDRFYDFMSHVNVAEIPDDLFEAYKTNLAEFEHIQAKLRKYMYNEVFK